MARLRARLFKNHLSTVKGNLIVKTVNEAMLTIPEVCASPRLGAKPAP
jgi:hypothetical protein